MPVNRKTISSGTATGTFQSAGVGVADVSGDWTIKCLVSAFSTAPGPTPGNARLVVEESADEFATVTALAVLDFVGTLPPEGQVVSVRKREFTGTSLIGKTNGMTAAEVRVNIAEVNGSSPVALTYNAWIEY